MAKKKKTLFNFATYSQLGLPSAAFALLHPFTVDVDVSGEVAATVEAASSNQRLLRSNPIEEKFSEGREERIDEISRSSSSQTSLLPPPPFLS